MVSSILLIVIFFIFSIINRLLHAYVIAFSVMVLKPRFDDTGVIFLTVKDVFRKRVKSIVLFIKI